MPVNNIFIRGEKQTVLLPSTTTDGYLQLSETYQVGTSVRGAVEGHSVNLTDDKLVEFVFDDGTTWISNADTIEEVFPEATQRRRSADGAFEIPSTLRNATTERGIPDILLKVVNIFTKKKVEKIVGNLVHSLAADLERKQLENQSGLYRIDDSFNLVQYETEVKEQPYLLFLHGTASSTKSSFGKLYNNNGSSKKTVWQELRALYNNNTLAFQHETLTKSPLQNAVELAKQLPQSATLHLVSHSRGGLVGDILSRFCNSNEKLRGFDEAEIAYLRKTNREEDLKNIEELNVILQGKKITIGKFVRVACPANGTILASKRLDNLFNILLNLIGVSTGIAASPVYTTFKSLIAAVIDAKNSEDALPGIAAMNPESPFLKVLNSPGTTIDINNPLIVISGNCKIGFQLKALVIIASKLFYAVDNDLVVNTRSMYLGSKRHDALKYLFDETTDVDHFHYFANEKTSNALLDALKADGDLAAAGFKSEQQKRLVEAERNALLKAEGGKIFVTKVTGNRPIAVVLPGIMGSNLSVAGDSIWINYLGFLKGDLRRLDITNTEKVEASSLVGTSYAKLVNYLSSAYDVVTFAYDWRLSLTDSAKIFNDKILDLLKYGQPIKIIGHSMGGVLVREFIIRHDDTWSKLNRLPGCRLLFLGAPLGGSFRIPAVLFGQDAIINKLSKIDIFHTKQELLEYFSKMPGLWSLLPLTTDVENDFVNKDVWHKMANALGIKDWPLPVNGTDLSWLKDYRDFIQSKLKSIDYSNAVYIAGRDKATPCGYQINKTQNGEELVFLSTAEGDQSVTWASGIPQPMVDNNSVYYVNVTHGALANEPAIFTAIGEILAKGSTNQLTTNRPAIRSEEKVFRSPVPTDFDISEDGVEATLLGLDSQGDIVEPETPLHVSMSNGDLKYATYPVLAGHFFRDAILYAEAQIDDMLEGELSRKHLVGIYPGEAGSSEVILFKDETANNQSIKGGIIVGLGRFGDLTSYLLTKTVEQGIARYLLDVNSKLSFKKMIAGDKHLGVSPLIIGCGYGGLSIEDSVRSILQGIQNANLKIEKLFEGHVKLIEQVEFIELYEDRALSCFYTISKLEKDQSRSLKIKVDKKEIKTLFGSKRRIPAETSEGWWNRITVQEDKTFQPLADRRKLLFSASTGGAREEKKALYVNPVSIEKIIRESSVGNFWTPQSAKTLFEKLLPVEFKEQFKRQFNINWILDDYTASLPWELLQDAVDATRPLCVNTGMIRQLRVEDYRPSTGTVTDFTALVVGEPVLGEFLTPLPAANEEGNKVATILKERKFLVTTLLNEDGTATSRNINEALAINSYKIIHLAGHGLFDKDNLEHSGMVIGENEYLTSADIKNMSTVPELVFVNCCYLGRTDPEAEEFYRNTHKLAANIGTQLIYNGVKAVVVAGWAVNDAAALRFTEVFYRTMFDEDNCFGDAIRKARKTIYEEFKQESNTWGAYQCYGDPYYKFRNDGDGNKPFDKEFVIPEEAEIELFNLQNELKTGRYTQQELLQRLAAISAAVDRAGFRQATVIERVAMIYAAMSEYRLAISKFRELLTMEKADFSVTSLEKYCNIRMKKCVEDYFSASKNPQGVNNEEKQQWLEEQRKGWLKEADEAISGLELLLQISPTAERHNLLGSAYKRKGILTKGPNEKREAYNKATHYYAMANKLQLNNKAYGLTNWLALESILMLSDGDGRTWGRVVKDLEEKELYKVPSKKKALATLGSLSKTAYAYTGNMDYWLMIEGPNCELCELIVSGEVEENKWNKVAQAYKSIWSKGGSKGDKQAETEHLQLLVDAVSLSGNETLKKRIEKLKDDLQSISNM
jgi:CHAT domain-containing protein